MFLTFLIEECLKGHCWPYDAKHALVFRQELFDCRSNGIECGALIRISNVEAAHLV